MEAIWNHRKQWVHAAFVDRKHRMRERNGGIDYMEEQDWYSGLATKCEYYSNKMGILLFLFYKEQWVCA